jgi:hypothetical protein
MVGILADGKAEPFGDTVIAGRLRGETSDQGVNIMNSHVIS